MSTCDLEIVIENPKPDSNWVSGYIFETLLREELNISAFYGNDISFKIPESTYLPVDTIVRLLNLLNQLQHKKYNLTVLFEGESESMGYLNRIGFFDFLNPNVTIKPERPTESGRVAFKGNNSSVIELESVTTTKIDNSLPERISQTIFEHFKNESDEEKKKLKQICQAIFSELITNIYEHSKTELDGFAVLQLYKGDNPRAEVIVCDSGIGLMESLKPSLKSHNAKFANHSGKELIAEIFEVGGVTSKPPTEGAGNGLETCFRQAKKMNSDVSIRLKTEQFRLMKVAEVSNLSDAFKYMDGLIPIEGTFISFSVPLRRRTIDKLLG